MSLSEDEGRFVLYQNKRRREGKRDAHYTGKIMVNGEWYFLDMWKNTGAKDSKIAGEEYFSGKVGNKITPKQPKDYHDDFDDDIPF